MKIPSQTENAGPAGELYSQKLRQPQSPDGLKKNPILGEGDLRYEVVGDWAKLPVDLKLGEVAGVAIDDSDIVYVFTRGEHPIVVLNRDGDVLRTVGHGVFKIPHGLHIGPDGTMYCTDSGDHTVRRCSPEGKVLQQIGIPGRATAFMSGEPFCQCTHTAHSPRGEIYVADGYGNACVHKFTNDGRHLTSWGRSGCAPGEFFIPHNIVCDPEGLVYVADRENHRVQVFDGDGRYLTQWNNLHRPCALHRSRDGLFYVGELSTFFPPFLNHPNLGPRLVVLDGQGQVLARLSAGPAGISPGCFIAPHGIAVDSRGDIYVGEVSHSAWQWMFPKKPMPDAVPSLHKLRRLVKT